MSNSPVFIDTNILVYAYDLSSGEKHTKATQLIESCWSSRQAVISSQVLQELSTTLLRKITKPLPLPVVTEIVTDLLQWTVISADGQLVVDALALLKKHSLSLWDGLIISAARRATCATLYSEDLSHTQSYGGVRVVNPFLS